MEPRYPGNFTNTLLEEALSRYANVEPPAGLERRVLARLTKKRAGRQRLLRGLAVAFVAIVVMVGAAQRFATAHLAFGDHTSTARNGEAHVPNIATTQSIVVLPVVLDGGPRRARVARAASSRRPGPVEREQIVRTSLISDLQLDSLSLSTLDLATLSGNR